MAMTLLCATLFWLASISTITVVPAQSSSTEEKQTDYSSTSSSSSSDRLDINRASVDELMRLPGIGPVLARRIVEHRRKHGPFRRPQDLIIVRGMSPGRFRLIAPHVRT